MNGGFDFEQLVELCQRTREETRRSAVRDGPPKRLLLGGPTAWHDALPAC